MKKFLLVTTAFSALLLTGCTESGNTDYKAKGEALAKQLTELCEKQDTTAVLELEKAIRTQEEEIVASGDSVAAADFRNALMEARQISAPFITTSKIESGMSKEDAIQDVVNDVMEGRVDIDAVAKATDAALQKEIEKKKAAKKQ